jgi:SAM-dependent methyltransferase
VTEVMPGDAAGAETLEIMSAAPRYNAWQFEQIAPYVGQRVLEVGSGIGNMSAHIVAAGRDVVVLTDTDAWYQDQLRTRFADRPEVQVGSLTLPDPTATGRFRPLALDTVIALNVVEHIEDDVGTLRSMAELLAPAGRVVVLVPALPSIFGSLDEELGHYRRYTRASLAAAFQAAGLALEQMFWFNRVGTLGWWFNACVRRTRLIPLAQLRSFDSLVPVLRAERFLPLPFGQSLIAIGRRDG